jgi:formylglycine-generating enzyme required for sulfatase activity
MSDIFISYASADRSRVKPLVEVLRQRGWSVWWDRTIPPGKTWDQVIEEALTGARCVIVLWTRDSVKSDWVRTEAEEGKRRGILVPILLDAVTMPLEFRRIQAANLAGWAGESPNPELDEMLHAVAEVLSRPGGEPVVPVADSKVPREEDRPSPVSAGTGLARRNIVLIGLLAAAGIGGLAWYFASSPRQVITPKDPEGTAEAGTVRKNQKDGLSYVWIPPGKFTMGCSKDDRECQPNEGPPHEVTLTRGFWLGRTEVTVAAYNRFLGENDRNAELLGGIGAMARVNVDWEAANGFCQWAGMRLPTEAEWEYAARANTTGARYGAVDAVAWHKGNTGELHPVAGKQPNAWGLHDMLGNAWEWVKDWYGEYGGPEPVVDPGGPSTGPRHNVRGGSWYYAPEHARASRREPVDPGVNNFNVGFRCAGELR